MDLIKQPLSKPVLWYLRILAKIQIKKINPLIIGAGGSSGKTSLSSLINLVLKTKYKTLYSEGKNSETGIPLGILGLKIKNYSLISWFKILILSFFKVFFNWKKYQVYIAEMGIDSPFEPKNMTYLLKIIRPKVGVLTNVSYEHSMNFDTLVEGLDEEEKRRKILDLTAREELLLLSRLPKGGTAILNIDDIKINEKRDKIKANIITVSEKRKDADFYISEVVLEKSRFVLKFTANSKNYALRLECPLSAHFAKTICLAIATCFSLGIKVKDSIDQIERHFVLPPGRFSVFKGVKNTLVIDSSYNCGIETMLDSLSFLSRISGKRRKVGILGDLRELGTISEFAHQKIAEKISETLDFAILIGPLMQKFATPILEGKNIPFKSFLTFSEAKYFILANLKSRDLILVKGSQNTLFLERAVEMLLKNPNDKDKLCRRGRFWDKKRQETP